MVSEAPSTPTPHFLVLQAWRALAAFLVVAGHANYEALSVMKSTGMPYSYIRYPGGTGVEIFFVISGFVIVYASRNLMGRAGSWKAFILRRIIRIVPLYWFYTTLMLMVALMFPHQLDTARAEFWHLIQSYLFIPHIRPLGDAVRPFMHLGWSLNYEMYFYGIFAVLLCLPLNRLAAILSLFLVSSVLAGFFLPESWVALNFWCEYFVLEFLAGALIGFAYLRGFRLPLALFWPMALCAFAILLYLFIPPGGSLQGWLSRFVVGIILVAAGTLPRGIENMKPPRLLTALGDSSYSLYLSHPFILGAVRLVFTALGLSLNVYFFVSIMACLICGHVLYWLLERPLQKFLLKKLKVRHGNS
jgi:peptidoglycan/LPS O-acetylase OafA/YrhL